MIQFTRRTLKAYFQLKILQQQRLVVDQLRKEATLKRVNVSKAIEDLKVFLTPYNEVCYLLIPLHFQKFIREKEQEDYLLAGFPSQKANPYREKSSCNVL